ncbi:MAG: T9SS type A sorting domain-containing protein [Bacteroidales bacterium]|jgi:hypothetical protein|nr:T9SS type A sorting domain-containing protein [Bacteroidales bacterium]
MKKLLITFSIISLSITCFSQTWPKIYGDHLNSKARKVIETHDKGYVIGSTIDVGEYHRYIWLIKTDIDGNILWDKKIGEGSYRYYLNDFNQTYDGGYILTFRSSKYDVDEDPVVMKLNACAEIEWCTTLHSEGFNRGVKVIQTPDSNYLTLSMYHSPDWSERIFLFKLNQTGEVLWSNLYAQLEPGIFNEEGFDLTIFPSDSTYLITGSCDYTPTGGNSAFWVKVNQDGDEVENIIWNDSTAELTAAYETIHKTSRFYTIGDKPYGYVFNATIFKLNNDGEKLYSKRILLEEGHATGTSLSLYRDSLLVVGSRWQDSGPPYHGHCEIFLTDTLGNIITHRTLYEDLQEPRNTAITYDDKILAMCGFYIGSNWDIYFYKLNEYLEDDTLYNIQLTYDSLCPGPIQSDTMTIDCDVWVDIDEMFEPEPNSLLKIFPNPASNHIQIEIPTYLLSEAAINGFNVISAHKLEGDLIIAVYDGFGKHVLEKEVSGSDKNIDLDISGASSGLHIVTLTLDGSIIASGKFLVNK